MKRINKFYHPSRPLGMQSDFLVETSGAGPLLSLITQFFSPIRFGPKTASVPSQRKRSLQNTASTFSSDNVIVKILIGFCLLIATLPLKAQMEILIEELTPDGVELKLFNEAPITADTLSKTIVLERSLDLENWDKIGEFDSTFILEEFIDTNPIADAAFYRVGALPKLEETTKEVIVQFKWDASPDELEKLCAAGGLLRPVEITETPAMQNRSEPPLVCFVCSGSPEETAEILRSSPLVLSAVPAIKLNPFDQPNDLNFLDGSQFSLLSEGAGSRAQGAWARGYHGSKEVVIAILDTGIDPEHPDLRNNIWTNPGEVPDNGIDDDGNGYIDDLHGWDFTAPGGGDPYPVDGEGHGTHVAGISGAEGNNGIGIAGVNWNVSILPIRVIDEDGGSLPNMLAAMDYLNGLKNAGVNIVVANYSLGLNPLGSQDSIRWYPHWHSRFVDSTYAGILSVCAAGNNRKNDNDLRPVLPASFDTTSTEFPTQAPYDSIISVASISQVDGELAYYSNFGSYSVDVATTGGGGDGAILSTIPGGDYARMSGTSMAAPIVSGAIALHGQKYPSSHPSARKDAILNSVSQIPGLTGQVSSGGFLNIEEALGYDSGDVNFAPQAVDDRILVSGSGGQYDVVGNDLDTDGDGLEVVRISQAKHGLVEKVSAQEIRYTITNSRFNKDSFTYTISDGSEFSSATVTVLNNTGNSGPIPFDDHITVESGMKFDLTPLLWNDRDPNGDRLTIECAGLCDGVGISPQHGIIIPSGSFYQSLSNFVGEDKFTYRVTDGKLSSWATVSVTVVAVGEELRAPKLRRPKNNKENVLRRTRFKWRNVPGAMGYNLEIARGRKGKVIAGFSEIPEEQFLLAKDRKLEADRKHFARVQAIRDDGLPGTWSKYHKFVTRERARPGEGPRLLGPRNAVAIDRAVAPDFSWEENEEADEYLFQLAIENTLPSSILTEFSTTTESFRHSIDRDLEAGLVYFWRVIPVNDMGLGEPSEWRSFSTRPELNLQQPILLSPTNPAVNLSRNPTFAWILDEDVMTYQLEIWDIEAALQIRNFSGITGSQFTLPQGDSLDYGAKLKWRVKALDSMGNSSPWSSFRIFTVKDAPVEVPVLSEPADGKTDFSRTGTFRWLPTGDGERYRLQVSEDPDFNSFRIDVVILNREAFYKIPDLDGMRLNRNRQYYWRVHAQNGEGQNSQFSEVLSFTSADSKPNGVPTLQSPGDGVSGQNLQPILTWSSISETQSPTYHLQIFETTLAGVVVKQIHDKYGITNTAGIPGSYRIPSDLLAYNTRYRWKIRGISPSGIPGDFSGSWDFRTKEGPPSIPTLVSPVNVDTGFSRIGTFTWNASSNASIYRLQVSLLPDFSTTRVDVIISGTSYSVPGENNKRLQRLTKYYWRVHSQNASGQNSQWSVTRSFTAADSAPGTPILVSPANGNLVERRRPTFTWNGSNGATEYVLKIWEVVNGTQQGNVAGRYVVAAPNDGQPISFRIPADDRLKVNQRYRWTVHARSLTGIAGTAAPTWDFRTPE